MRNNVLYIILGLCLSISSAYADKLSEIKSAGVLKAGVVNNYEPFGFKSRTGQIVGFDVSILKYIAKELKVELKLIPIDVKNYANEVNSGNVDIIAAALSHTIKKEKQVDFTITYFFDGQSILGNANSIATSYKNFEGKNIGVIKDSISSKVFKVIQPLANIVSFYDYEYMISSLKSGKVDAVTTNAGYLFKKAQKSKGAFKMIGKPFTVEPYAMAIKENESNFRDELNIAIQKFVKTGEYEVEYKKWFSKKILKRKPELWPN